MKRVEFDFLLPNPRVLRVFRTKHSQTLFCVLQGLVNTGDAVGGGVGRNYLTSKYEDEKCNGT